MSILIYDIERSVKKQAKVGLPGQLLRVIFLIGLPSSGNCHVVLFSTVSNRRTSRNKGICRDINRCYKVAVAADEGVVADIGMVLVGTIVVDEDYSTANVNVLPQRGVANVGQVADPM